jgi:hypothetical protein
MEKEHAMHERFCKRIEAGSERMTPSRAALRDVGKVRVGAAVAHRYLLQGMWRALSDPPPSAGGWRPLRCFSPV